MKILVVDDETDVQSLFEQKFRREIRSGLFEFSFSFSGEEALDYLAAHSSEVVMILSDINMPGMSGIELLKTIRTEHPSAPPQVMMITAYGDSETKVLAIELGADDFLTKPVDFNQLKEKLLSLH
ncbi:DNA-binding transcriptional regulator NtrC [Dyadobacter sp. CECT 9275]|uniref:DNA-binding transcriptional regulator NtrC n=1 Tax=Dyadobacter helix TaxID=2822344 RepID=A0A916NBU4_9BACT|nr:response regulator [Dyadobacter sp. CECT 9275]CAG4997905.1 DNA-binding transcriptional regulator NtrC [Dyadobacter sp. CECT 9275]